MPSLRQDRRAIVRELRDAFPAMGVYAVRACVRACVRAKAVMCWSAPAGMCMQA